MAKWEKTLKSMLNDPKPVSYRYAEAAAVLAGLGFQEPPKKSGSSHRAWRYVQGGGPVYVDLVEKGSGTLKPYLIRDMIAALRLHGLIPTDME